MKNKLLSKFLIAICVLQLIVLVFCVGKYEFILHYGKEIRLRTAPVDPVDIFRGRYVILNYDIQDYVSSKEVVKKFHRGEICYLILTPKDGVYEISRITHSKPNNEIFLKLKVRYSYDKKIRFDIPFDRFYMQEYKAKKAEELYRKANSRSRSDKSVCYASIVVYDGDALIKDIYINGVAIAELAESKSENN